MPKDDEIPADVRMAAEAAERRYRSASPVSISLHSIIIDAIMEMADRARRAPDASVIKDEEIPTDVQRLADFRADWLVDAVACSTQNRAFLRGEEEEDVVATDSIYRDGKKAVEMAIMTDRARRAPDAAVTAVVKPLEWGEPYNTDGYEPDPAFPAQSSLGEYMATRSGWFIQGVTQWGKAWSINEAKAAAQADYEKRILSALATPPALSRLGGSNNAAE